MESATSIAVIAAGFLFSCCLALLAEEMIFGAIFRLFFAPAAAQRQPDHTTPQVRRDGSGGQFRSVTTMRSRSAQALRPESRPGR